MVKIWQRQLISELSLTLLLCLASVIVLFVAIDYTLEIRFLKTIPLKELYNHYCYELLRQAPLLLPLAFLLSLMRLFNRLAESRELVALLSAGLSKARIVLLPLFMAILLTLLLYANEEWPRSSSHKAHKGLQIYRGSGLLVAAKEGEDLFWLNSSQTLYHIGSLQGSTAFDVTEFGLSPSGERHIVQRHQEMPINESFVRLLKSDELPLSYLFGRQFKESALTDQDRSDRASLLRRLSMPLITLLCPLLAMRLALRYRRGGSTLWSYGAALVVFFVVYALLDAFAIVIES